ncbi:MAG TPA: hypothetical protein VJ720_02690, partial [Chitinophaga sp.]|nr:hypothetical protein [Chitinophaga sp.]
IHSLRLCSCMNQVFVIVILQYKRKVEKKYKKKLAFQTKEVAGTTEGEKYPIFVKGLDINLLDLYPM